MQFASLGSGSRGNATLVEAGDTCLMVDCGFSVTEVERRMARLDRQPSDLAAVLVTHEHGDHMSGVARLARRYNIPVWMTRGSWAAHKHGDISELNLFSAHEDSFTIGELQVAPFPVPHDAREPSQFVFRNNGGSLGVLTDTGTITQHIVDCLSACSSLLLECNHDTTMLAQGHYPSSLKMRVGGRLGHLNNQQSAALLSRLDYAGLKHVVAAHLSDKNNTPELAREALAGVLECEPGDIPVADQAEGLPWHQVS